MLSNSPQHRAWHTVVIPSPHCSTFGVEHPGTRDELRQLNVGELWAYRHHGKDPLVEVRVLRFGTKPRRPRVLVRFVADEFEGLEDWVPVGRLKVPWDDAEEFAAREKRWNAIASAYRVDDTAEYRAAEVVFDTAIDPELAGLPYTTPGVCCISDVDRLSRQLGLEPDELRGEPLSFEDDGELIVPWPVTEKIARRAAEHTPDPVLRYVEKQEARQQHDKIYGRYMKPTRYSRHYVEVVARLDEDPANRPCRELLRQWCRAEAVEQHDELRDLRQEVHRLAGLTLDAIRVLRQADLKRDAARLERALGVRKLPNSPS